MLSLITHETKNSDFESVFAEGRFSFPTKERWKPVIADDISEDIQKIELHHSTIRHNLNADHVLVHHLSRLLPNSFA